MCDNATSVTAADVPFDSGRDVWWSEAIPQQSAECPVAWMDAEDPLFLLYTSGSTGIGPLYTMQNASLFSCCCL